MSIVNDLSIQIPSPTTTTTTTATTTINDQEQQQLNEQQCLLTSATTPTPTSSTTITNNDNNNNQSDLLSLSQIYYTKCGLCKDLIHDPKVLHGCFHSFCQQCLERLTTNFNQQSTITCPLCSQETQIPLGGLSSLLSDYSLMNLIENQTSSTSSSSSSSSSQANGAAGSNMLTTTTTTTNQTSSNLSASQALKLKFCPSCKTHDSLIVAKCFNCSQFLCQNCCIAHQYMLCYDNHNVVYLKDIVNNNHTNNNNHVVGGVVGVGVDDLSSSTSSLSSSVSSSSSSSSSSSTSSPLQSQSSTPKTTQNGTSSNSSSTNQTTTTTTTTTSTNDRLLTCNKHKTNQYKYFCVQCNQLLCQDCCMLNDHQTHDISSLQDVGIQQVNSLQLFIDNSKLHTIDLRQQYDIFEQTLTYLSHKYQKAHADIDSTYNLYKQLLDAKKIELKRQLDQCFQNKQLLLSTILNKIEDLASKLDHVNNFSERLLKTSKTATEILLFKKPIESKINNLLLSNNDLLLLNQTNNCLFDVDFITNYQLFEQTIKDTFGCILDSAQTTSSSTTTTTTTTNNTATTTTSSTATSPVTAISTIIATTTGSQSSTATSPLTLLTQQHHQHQQQPSLQAPHHNHLNLLSSSSSVSSTSSGYKPKPIGPPNSHNHNNSNNNSHQISINSSILNNTTNVNSYSPKLNDMIDNPFKSVNGSNSLFSNDLITNFDSWSNGGSDIVTNSVGQSADLAGLHNDQLLDLSSTRLNAVHSTSNPFLPSKCQLKRQKMIYNCKFGEFGINDGQFTEPSGVAINAQNDIIVADTNSHRIQIFDREGRFKFKFGECGKREGQLLYPNRVAVVKQTGDIIVTERSPTHQIQIYNQYGQFVRKFGANILQHPRGVCVDNKGRIIVVECKVMRVIIFDQMGNVIHKFNCSKYLEFPNGVCCNDKQEIFISDNRAHCIKVFNYDGQFLRQIGGEGITNYPIGVGINSNGEVLVADNHNNFNLTVFTQTGEFITALESKVKHAQCFDVGLMDDGSIVLASKDYRIYVYKYITSQQQQQSSNNNNNSNLTF